MFLDSFMQVVPCASDTAAAGIIPPPILQSPQTNGGADVHRRRRHFGLFSRKPQPHPDVQTPLLGCLSRIVSPGPTTPSPGYPKYNMLMLIVDQMRAPRWLPTNGGQAALDAILPNIANLRNHSYVFENCYAAATNCSPSRSALMTGLYAPQTCVFVTQDPPASPLPYPPSLQPYNGGQGFLSIANVLSQTDPALNYYCVHFGKWHLSDNPQENNYSCNPGSGPNPGGNGPSDYGFTAPKNYDIPTPPTLPQDSPYPSPYPSPNGESNQGNSGDFLGTQTVNPIGDVPAYNPSLGCGLPAQDPCPAPQYYSSITLNAPGAYNQLNDTATADAFTAWLSAVGSALNPSQYWFAVVSFVNPHDISQFPYAFGLIDPHSPCGPPNEYFCEPSNPSFNPFGYQPPTVPPSTVTAPVPYSSVHSGELEATSIAPFPYYPAGSGAPLYANNASGLPQNLYPTVSGYNTAWNYSDHPQTYNPPSGKPNLQGSFLLSTKNLTGQILDSAGTDPTGWCTFLNYYIWMQACVDQQIGNVLYATEPPPGGNPSLAAYPAVAANTLVLFTADHGEYGGSHGLHAKGGALYDEAINVPLFVSLPGQRAAAPGVARSYVCSGVDILPFLYSFALGNESWRYNPNDIVSYLAGRESLMDAIFAGTGSSIQRRLSGFANTNPTPSSCYQPYVLHTCDESWNLALTEPTNYPPHAVAYRTIDDTLQAFSGQQRDQGPFGGGKLGVYSYWAAGGIAPIQDSTQQFEFYNYQQNAPGNSGNLNPNLGEIGNDWWASNNSNAQGGLYQADFQSHRVQNELTYIDPKIQTAHSNALALWNSYVALYQNGGCT